MELNTTQNISLSGYVKDNRVIFNDNLQLPDGIQVNVIVSRQAAKSSSLCGIWKDDRPVVEIVNDIIDSRSMGRETQ
jgi:hypothetical protein